MFCYDAAGGDPHKVGACDKALIDELNALPASLEVAAVGTEDETEQFREGTKWWFRHQHRVFCRRRFLCVDLLMVRRVDIVLILFQVLMRVFSFAHLARRSFDVVLHGSECVSLPTSASWCSVLSSLSGRFGSRPAERVLDHQDEMVGPACLYCRALRIYRNDPAITRLRLWSIGLCLLNLFVGGRTVLPTLVLFTFGAGAVSSDVIALESGLESAS